MAAYPAVLWLSVLAALFGSFQFGYHLGVLNTCLEWMAADLGFSVARGGSVVVSAALIGAALGSLGAGQFADSVGPGKAMAANNLSLLVGSLLYAVCPGGIWAAVVGRFLAGLGAGAASLYVPRYLAEISPASIRGGVATLNQVFICLGILVAYALGLPYARNRAVHVHIGSHAVAWWRVMVAAGVLPALTQAPPPSSLVPSAAARPLLPLGPVPAPNTRSPRTGAVDALLQTCPQHAASPLLSPCQSCVPVAAAQHQAAAGCLPSRASARLAG